MSKPDGYWSKHFHEAYKDDAANPKYPKPIRLAFLAYGTHKANGHARFKQREIGAVLGEFDERGTFLPADRFVVNRAIKTAIEWGLLAEGSYALCLIVPGHRMQGHLGDPDAKCDRHRTVAETRNTLGSTVAVRANGSSQPLRKTATVQAQPFSSSSTGPSGPGNPTKRAAS